MVLIVSLICSRPNNSPTAPIFKFSRCKVSHERKFKALVRLTFYILPGYWLNVQSPNIIMFTCLS